MKKIKGEMKNTINKKEILIMFLMFVFFLTLHFFFVLDTIDDRWFKSVLDNQTLMEYLVNRYDTWSSRLIIETVLILILQLNPIFWMVIDAAMFPLIFYSIVKISKIQNYLIVELIIAISITLVPLDIYSSAGWVATTTNYLWPVAIGLYCLSCMLEMLEGKSKNCLLLIPYFACLLFSSNQEQMCALLFGFCFIANIIYIFRNRKIKLTLCVSLFMIIGMLLFILFCPGNAVRSIQEINLRYLEFANFDFIHKLMLGTFSTICTIADNPNVIVLLMMVSITILGVQTRNLKITITGFIPWIVGAILIQSRKANWEIGIGAFMSEYIVQAKDLSIVKAIPITIIILISAISILYVIYKSLEKEDCIFICIILLAAFLSRVIMGFSATIYASGERTFVFMYYLILVADAQMLKNIDNNYKITNQIGS